MNKKILMTSIFDVDEYLCIVKQRKHNGRMFEIDQNNGLTRSIYTYISIDICVFRFSIVTVFVNCLRMQKKEMTE